ASISAQISGVSSALTVNSKFAAWPDGAALPTAWTAWSYAGGTIVRDNSRQSSGYAALMTASSANQLGMYQRFYLTPGKYFLVAT
ncbi:hypothetical protein, partial [Escherichia coli]|uniref:hypothetical protein n=1 Tax=Escherichia coli TaxID=562 RepID=UPI003D36C29E